MLNIKNNDIEKLDKCLSQIKIKEPRIIKCLDKIIEKKNKYDTNCLTIQSQGRIKETEEEGFWKLSRYQKISLNPNSKRKKNKINNLYKTKIMKNCINRLTPFNTNSKNKWERNIGYLSKDGENYNFILKVKELYIEKSIALKTFWKDTYYKKCIDIYTSASFFLTPRWFNIMKYKRNKYLIFTNFYRNLENEMKNNYLNSEALLEEEMDNYIVFEDDELY